MIVGSHSPADQHVDVMWMQHDCYGPSLAYLFSSARVTYLRAQEIVGVETELGKVAQRVELYDHRTLQYAHDLIAAWFRHKYESQIAQPYLPGILDNQTHEDRIARLWHSCYRAEVDRLLLCHANLALLILNASAFANPDRRGIDAEHTLAELLHAEYASLFPRPW